MSDTIIGRAYVELIPFAGAGFKEAADAEIAGTGAAVEDRSLAEGTVIGGAIGAGVGEGLAKEEPKVEAAAKGLASKIGSVLESAGKSLGSIGIPFAAGLETAGGKLKDADAAGTGLDATLLALGKTSTIVGLALGAGVVAESLHLFDAMQQAEYQIAATSDISVKKAELIGDAFESTAFKTYESAPKIAAAFAPISGQLGLIQGHALGAELALKEMNVALELNEAISGDLTTTTGDLAQVQQAFGIKTKDAATAADVLFNVARLTNTSLDTVAQTLGRLHVRTGEGVDGLLDLGTLLVALGAKGAIGAQGTRVLASGLEKLLGGSKEVDEQLHLLGSGTTLTSLTTRLAQVNAEISGASSSSLSATNPLEVRLANLRAEIAQFASEGAGTSTNPLHGTYQVLTAQEQELSAQISETTAARSTSTEGLQAEKTALEAEINGLGKLGGVQLYVNGKFIGMKAAITELHAAFEKLTIPQQNQAAATLFGSQAANTFLKLIDAGPEAFDRYTAAVGRSNSAHEAAIKNNDTIHRQLEVAISGIEDEGVAIGRNLLPYLRDFTHWGLDFLQWGEKNRKLVVDFAELIGGVLTLAVGRFVVGKGADMIKWFGGLSTSAENASKKVVQSAETTATQVTEKNATVAKSFETTATTATVSGAKVDESFAGQRYAATETGLLVPSELAKVDESFVAEGLAAGAATEKVDADLLAQRGAGEGAALGVGAGAEAAGARGFLGTGASASTALIGGAIALQIGYTIGQGIEQRFGGNINTFFANALGLDKFQGKGAKSALDAVSKAYWDKELAHLLDLKTQNARTIQLEATIAEDLGILTHNQAGTAAARGGLGGALGELGVGTPFSSTTTAEVSRRLQKAVGGHGNTVYVIHPPAGSDNRQIAAHVLNQALFRSGK